MWLWREFYHRLGRNASGFHKKTLSMIESMFTLFEISDTITSMKFGLPQLDLNS